MCHIFVTLMGLLLYFHNGCQAFNPFHNIQKRQAQTEIQATVGSGTLLNLASGLQNILNKAQQANIPGQFQFSTQFGMYTQKNQEYEQDHLRRPPGRFGPPGRYDFGPPGQQGGPGFGPPGEPGFGPPGQSNQHFGPPGFGRHPPPPGPPGFGRHPPPPPHEGPPGRFYIPGSPGFGPPGPHHWQGFEPPRHYGFGQPVPPFYPPDFGRPPPPLPPPPPFEGGMQHGNYPSPNPPTGAPPHQQNNNNYNQQKEELGNSGKGNPGIVLVQDEDQKNIAGYLDGNFPIILLGDNEIR